MEHVGTEEEGNYAKGQAALDVCLGSFGASLRVEKRDDEELRVPNPDGCYLLTEAAVLLKQGTTILSMKGSRTLGTSSFSLRRRKRKLVYAHSCTVL